MNITLNKLRSDFDLLGRNLGLKSDFSFIDQFPKLEGKTIIQIGGAPSLSGFLLLQNPKLTLFSEFSSLRKGEEYFVKYLQTVFSDFKIETSFEKFEENTREKFCRDVLVFCLDSQKENIEQIFFKARNGLKNGGEIIFFSRNISVREYWDILVKKGELIDFQKSEFFELQKGEFLYGKLCLPKLKIALCSLSIGEQYKKNVLPGILGKEIYCKKFGYDFRQDEDVFDSERPPAWSKVKLILKCLEEKVDSVPVYDYVVWIDSDTLIQDFRKRLEDIIGTFQDGKDLLFTMDFHCANSGVLFIKNTDWAKNFFEKVYAQEQFIHDPNWEQTSIIYLMENNKEFCQDKIRLLDPSKQREFNSYYFNFKKGDFLIHFPGCFRLGKNNGLDDMMRRLNPIQLEEDTEEQFKERLNRIEKMNSF